MITAVDTNVLLDIFRADPRHGRSSAEMLRRCLKEGAVVACEVVWTEAASVFPHDRLFRDAMKALAVGFSPLSEDASVHAAAAWRKYRTRGGKRGRVVADFLVGAHAAVQCDRLLTRDRGFYRGYFGGLRVLEPVRGG